MVDLRDWEHPIGDPRQRDRDISLHPYDRQEMRVAEYLPLGGGDDPVGFLICSHRYTHWLLKVAIEHGVIPADWQQQVFNDGDLPPFE
jgi:hypothetical protein